MCSDSFQPPGSANIAFDVVDGQMCGAEQGIIHLSVCSSSPPSLPVSLPPGGRGLTGHMVYSVHRMLSGLSFCFVFFSNLRNKKSVFAAFP